MWMVQSLLQQASDHMRLSEQRRQLPQSFLVPDGLTLTDITEEKNPMALAAHLRRPTTSRRRINMDNLAVVSDMETTGQLCMGQVWQSLGSMILRAEDRTLRDPSYHTIMSHVQQVLAEMHHTNALPASLYNYDPAKDLSVVQRPPTLFLLSARIMSVLSDVAWKKYWAEETVKAEDYGFQLPPARAQPLLPHVGAEVWLELVLWACVEGGWITEAAWIVSEIQKRKGDPNMRWSVISWEGICQVKAPELTWTAILKLQIDKSRLNHITGIRIANSGTSSIEMGIRTVSQEVILTIIDGIINTSSCDTSAFGNSVADVYQSIADCRELLKRNQVDAAADDLNAIILRILESSGSDTEASPSSLQRLLSRRLKQFQYQGAGTESALHAQESIDQSAAILGLSHRMLDSFARQSNLQGSLQALANIQNIIDANRDTYIQEFASDLRERLRKGEEGQDLIAKDSQRGPTSLRPQIPIHALVSLLELITNSKYLDLGRWLLFNDDIDGGIIDHRLYSNPNLQPSLLHFATLTGDDELLNRVLQYLQPPLSELVLHSLLRCQIVLGKWDAVQRFLEHFKRTPGMSWIPSDVTAIAASIFQMSQSPSDQDQVIMQAKAILKRLLEGKYNPPRDASQLPNFTFVQSANQLARILKSIPGNTYHDVIAEESVSSSGQLHNIIEIPASAFNIPLEAIVECHGCAAGKDFWERWCSEPGSAAPYEVTGLREAGRHERVVVPELYMLRNVLRPIAQKMREACSISQQSDDSSCAVDNRPTLLKDDLELLQWGVSMYEKFGLSSKSINNAELPGVFGRLKDAKISTDEHCEMNE